MFRAVWLAVFASTIGTWMQNVAMGAFAFRLTGNSSFAAALIFAQNGPQLVLSTFAGVLADTFDRRRLMLAAQAGMFMVSCVLTLQVRMDNPSKALLLLTTVALGMCNTLNGPVFNTLLPNLVDREHMPGAISLLSTQMNLSRVIGPALGGLLQSEIDVWGVLAVNTASYLILITTLLIVDIPVSARRAAPSLPMPFLDRLNAGFGIARRDPLVRRLLWTMATFSFFSLPFITLMPEIGSDNLGLNTKGLTYGLLFASFGLGAATGALGVGTVLSSREPLSLLPVGLALFSVGLVVLGSTHHLAIAFLSAPVLGCAYFGTVTAMSTKLQVHLDDAVRGRVMALWMMAFGGSIPIGALLAAWIANLRSVSLATWIGGFWALSLSAVWRFVPLGTGGPAIATTATTATTPAQAQAGGTAA